MPRSRSQSSAQSSSARAASQEQLVNTGRLNAFWDAAAEMVRTYFCYPEQKLFPIKESSNRSM
jgi:hypothetical protein